MQLTIFSMIFTTLVLPVVVVTFLAIMNGSAYLKDQTNGSFSNTTVLIVVLTFVLSATSVPPTILSGVSREENDSAHGRRGRLPAPRRER